MTDNHTVPPPRPSRRRAVLLWVTGLGLLLGAGLFVLSACVPTFVGSLQTSIAGLGLYAALVGGLLRWRRR